MIVFTDVLALEDGQGGVINPADRSDKAIAMRELLTTVEDDEGFESTLTLTAPACSSPTKVTLSLAPLGEGSHSISLTSQLR